MDPRDEHPQPSRSSDHTGTRQPDAPLDERPTSFMVPRSQEGEDRARPSQITTSVPHNTYSNVPTDHYPFSANSAFPASPASVPYHDSDNPYTSAPDLTRSQPSTPYHTVPPLRSPSARFPQQLATPSGPRRRNTTVTRSSVIDYIVPTVDGVLSDPSKLSTRLAPTLKAARDERDKCLLKARWTGRVLNIAIGLQVLLGSLTTGLSAASSNPRSAAVQTTVLGALTTIVASYLARARGSDEPELSTTRVKELDRFIRECEAFDLDHGYDTSNEFDHQLAQKREDLERILGSTSGSDSEKPLSRSARAQGSTASGNISPIPEAAKAQH